MKQTQIGVVFSSMQVMVYSLFYSIDALYYEAHLQAELPIAHLIWSLLWGEVVEKEELPWNKEGTKQS